MNVPSDQVRYVVLHHTGHGEDHFDLMYERAPGEALTSWRLPNWPPNVGDVVESIGDHRRGYLEHEGEVSGNRGRVQRIISGIAHIKRTDCAVEVRANEFMLKFCFLPTVSAWSVIGFDRV